jgi:hypothetical protein
MSRKFVLSSAAIAALSTSAFAADLPARTALRSILLRRLSLGRGFISAPRRDLLKASTHSMISMTPFLAIAA